MSDKTRTFGPRYDAKSAVAECMDIAQAIVNDNLSGKSLPTDLQNSYVQTIRMWVDIAQVHATAALVLATEAASRKSP